MTKVNEFMMISLGYPGESILINQFLIVEEEGRGVGQRDTM